MLKCLKQPSQPFCRSPIHSKCQLLQHRKLPVLGLSPAKEHMRNLAGLPKFMSVRYMVPHARTNYREISLSSAFLMVCLFLVSRTRQFCVFFKKRTGNKVLRFYSLIQRSFFFLNRIPYTKWLKTLYCASHWNWKKGRNCSVSREWWTVWISHNLDIAQSFLSTQSRTRGQNLNDYPEKKHAWNSQGWRS